MNLPIETIGFGLSSLIFLLAGILVFKSIRQSRHPISWIAMAFACFVLSAIAGYTAYQNFVAQNNNFDLIEFVTMLLTLIGSGALLFGLLSLANTTSTETTGYMAVLSELERYRTGFEKVPFMVILKDHLGNYLYTNPVYQYFLGKKGQNLVGESDFKFFPRAQAVAFRQEEEKILDSGIPAMRDEEIRGVDGIRWIRFSKIPLKEDNRDRQTLLVSGQDITFQKQMEDEIQTIKDSIDQLKEILLDLTLVVDRSVLLERTVKWSGKTGNTNQVGIWQMMSDGSTAVLKYGVGKLANLIGTQIKKGRDLPWKVWQSGQVLVVEKYQNWPDRTPWIQGADFSTAIGLPLKTASQPVYVLTLFYENNAESFKTEQVNLLSILTLIAANQLKLIDGIDGREIENQEWQQKLEKILYRNRIEHILAVISTYFINVDIEKIDEAITHALETIVKLIGVDRGYLIIFPNEERGEQAYSYNSQKNTKFDELKDISRNEFQSILNKLNQLETIHYQKISALSMERDEAVGYLQAKGIKSFTAIPLISSRSLVGYLGFEAITKEVEFSQEILALLKISGEMFVNLVDRKHLAKAADDERERTQAKVQELEIRTKENTLITEMGDLLQACRIADEAYPIIIRFMEKLIPASSGALYINHDPKDPAENVAAWGDEPPGLSEHELASNECWALRRGRIYSIVDPASEPVCNHIKEPLQSGYMCVPLVAQGELVGLLHLRMAKEMGKSGFNQEQQQMAVKIGEYIAIPLTNLKLRDELRSQAIRDPLTKLYNRRYMEETLEREIRRANRHATSVGIIMFDIDKMKPINDRYGHDAGDLALKTLGRELLNLFRGEDVACRYGGDEFTIVLPEATLADVWRRAEQLRESVKRLGLQYEGKQIGPITLSIGVTAYPDHGASAERVILACDAASYAAKSEGGDRIMMGHKSESL